MKRHWPLIMLKIALFVTVAIAGFGQAILHLWNWLMPNLFRLPAITFWQAVGLMALSWILFGGWRGFRGPGQGYRRHWKWRMMERWEQMTPEERDKFREGMRSRCGHFPRAVAEPKA
ncbi:MAG TPA: hypothetical protein VFA74_13700 [Terriglobales bacterium]|nr:hypothetical protein [Terriglobales bacterium]